MLNRAIDIAVFGSTPLARLLAGLLAETHGRRVALIGTTNAAYRLARGIDLSVAPITRPEIWALLDTVLGETLRHLARIGGRNAYMRIDPLFLAGSAPAREALAHVRQVAAGFGHAVEPMPLDGNREGLVIRDAVLLNRARSEPDFDQWLENHGVMVLDPALCHCSFDCGSVHIDVAGTRVEAEMAVLADDDAILAHIERHGLPELLSVHTATSLLTEPARPLPAPMLIDLDSGAMLVQRHNRGIAAISPGTPDTAIPVIGRLLAEQQHLRRAGQAVFDRILASDGAPVIGKPRDGAPTIITGLGSIGAFLAPALARWLVGTASADERAVFESRAPRRPTRESTVADLGAPLAEVTA